MHSGYRVQVVKNKWVSKASRRRARRVSYRVTDGERKSDALSRFIWQRR